MKRLIPALMATVMLAGCGTAPGLVSAGARTGVVQAQSKERTEKGVRGMFIAVFKSYDKDQSNFLSPEEMPGKLALAGLAADAPEDPTAVMKRLDMNADGKVSLREFYRRELLQPVLDQFRADAQKAYLALDKNSDRALLPKELAGSGYIFEDLDRNSNGRITLSEFEDGIAATLEKGGSVLPVTPPAIEPSPAPVAPVEPAPVEPTPGGDPAAQ